MNVSTNKISATLLPEQLRAAFKDGEGFPKRDVYIKIYHSDTMEITMYNTRWYGGTRTEYRVCRIEEYHPPKQSGYVHTLPYSCSNGLEDGTPLTANAGQKPDDRVFFLESGFFCGKAFTPTIHIMASDVAQFFGMGVPAEHTNTPPDIFADWMDEQYDTVKAMHGVREANRQRKIAATIRKACGK